MGVLRPGEQKAHDEWVKLTIKQQRLRARKHYNGSCICYVAPGEGINGTRESGRDCLYSRLSWSEQNTARQYFGH